MILLEAERAAADMILVFTSRPSRLRRLLHGLVAQQVVAGARIAVLVQPIVEAGAFAATGKPRRSSEAPPRHSEWKGCWEPSGRASVRQVCEEGQTGTATRVNGRERRDSRRRGASVGRCPAAASSRRVTYA